MSFEAKSSFGGMGMGQVPLFNENLCVKNTSKTYHEDFSRKRYFGLS